MKTSKFYQDSYQDSIADTDRYTTDRYDLLLSIREYKDRYAIGFQVNSVQLGVVSASGYWTFKKDEAKYAKKTYRQVKAKVKETQRYIEENRPKFVLLLPLFMAAMQDIDIEHKEKSGITSYNQSIEVPRESDWRQTVYGDRYPTGDSPSEMNHINRFQYKQSVETKDTKRQRVYKYKYST